MEYIDYAEGFHVQSLEISETTALFRGCRPVAVAPGRSTDRSKGKNEGFVKIIALHEIVDGILIGLSKEAMVDEIENDVSEIDAFIDAPLGKHAFRDRPEFLKGIFTNTIQEFLPADVSGLIKLANRMVQPFAHEEIGFSGIAPV